MQNEMVNESKLSCTCKTSGFCEKRQTDVTKNEHAVCQLLDCEIADRIIASRVNPTRHKSTKGNFSAAPSNVSTFGTQLRTTLEFTSGLKITCGECLRYILELNKTNDRDTKKIARYLAANVPWHNKMSYKELVKVMEGIVFSLTDEHTSVVIPTVNIRDTDWATVVTTAPRENPTLTTCLKSIRSAGWEPIVFAEPDSVKLDGYHYVSNDVRLGAWHNWLKAVKWALKKTTAQYILTVQDDSLFHPDSRSLVEQLIWPNDQTGFISLYTAKHYSQDLSGNLKPFGVNKVITASWWGACALVFPRDVLHQLVEHPTATNWTGIPPANLSNKEKNSILQQKQDAPHLIQNVDSAIGKIMNSLKLDMFVVDPSPVQHVSQFSSIGHSNNNQGKRNCSRCADHSKPLFEQVFPKGRK